MGVSKLVLVVLPGILSATKYPEWFVEKLKNADRSDDLEECSSDSCMAPPHKFQKMLPLQPGVQWMQHGGYCGAWSVQRATLAKGAYISQQQVRDHAKFGGGHDEEILNTNIDGALEKLKISAEGFQYNVLPTPQDAAYLKFMKKHLVAGNPAIWMVAFPFSSYPDPGYTMDNTTNGIYGHIEPVVGILSNHDLTDEVVHDDDVFAYFDDASKSTYYAKPKQIPGTWSASTHTMSCPLFQNQCVWDQRGYIWAIKDLHDTRSAMPASLSISPYASEPYTRGGEKPIDITGTLTISGLQQGSAYDIYRWDSAESAFTYSDANKVKSFTAEGETFSFQDPRTFLSNSATYYRCVPAAGASLIV